MKIGVIADLHIDRHNRLKPLDYLKTLIEVVKSKNIDILLIAGDISNDFKLTSHFIEQLTQNLDTLVRFVPGNHDLWNTEDTSTQEIWDSYKCMSQCLVEHPYIINDEWAIVGHTAWYDYSYAAKRFSLEQLQKGKYYGATWQDKERVSWGISDQQLSKQAATQVRKDIQNVGARRIILVTHVVTHAEFIVPTPHRIFDFYNAYIGTSDFNDLYNLFDISYSVMGHVHFRKNLIEKGRHFVCPCLGYPRQWRTEDIYQEINETMQILEI
ncbi:metallophosphoesterase [Staphylococcus argenteus]|uniref:metallophosphoesterase n=1 Tax=Staphylococcus argenteus TaxID=985002 RepID=UPI00091C7091|nr:metallophosphoesterase [Staphylococcus argenteus]MCG9855133.1 metallophosphoesterase [Staphylococcus argenteus]MDR7649670.1 metallophosphoesterase [Staphylococcus argenteus]MDR7682157.1 metallophosphoesterase [Staphylococcus argenteus]SGW84929.1 putative phosphoesterase, putative [Staphylococcus argenteus]SGX55608.1 putative phosphoesterase, putative [Staphylococcus argenteus]